MNWTSLPVAQETGASARGSSTASRIMSTVRTASLINHVLGPSCFIHKPSFPFMYDHVSEGSCMKDKYLYTLTPVCEGPV